MDRRGFLKNFGIGASGAAIAALPGTVLAEPTTIDPSAPVSERDVAARTRATDEPQPKADYGLIVTTDHYVPNPDATRMQSAGNVTPRNGDTDVYVRAWIDEEVYGIVNAEGMIDLSARQRLTDAFTRATIAADHIMAPALLSLRQAALAKKFPQAMIERPTDEERHLEQIRGGRTVTRHGADIGGTAKGGA